MIYNFSPPSFFLSPNLQLHTDDKWSGVIDENLGEKRRLIKIEFISSIANVFPEFPTDLNIKERRNIIERYFPFTGMCHSIVLLSEYKGVSEWGNELFDPSSVNDIAVHATALIVIVFLLSCECASSFRFSSEHHQKYGCPNSVGLEKRGY